MTTESTDQTITMDERRRRLSRHIAGELSEGWRVQSQSDDLAVLIKGRRPNHVLHLILSLLTVGVWLPVWLALKLFGGEKRRTLGVDEFGNVQISDL